MQKALRIIGFIAFVIGLLLALFAGILAPNNAPVIITLVIIGIIVGLFNITSKEILPLLIASIALIVVQDAFIDLNNIIPNSGTVINNILSYLAKLMAPAAVIAAVRALVSVGFPKD